MLEIVPGVAPPRPARVVFVDQHVTDDDLRWLTAQLAPVGAVATRRGWPVDTSWVTVEAIR